jgi:hypothetical protein
MHYTAIGRRVTLTDFDAIPLPRRDTGHTLHIRACNTPIKGIPADHHLFSHDQPLLRVDNLHAVTVSTVTSIFKCPSIREIGSIVTNAMILVLSWELIKISSSSRSGQSSAWGVDVRTATYHLENGSVHP